jgi:hypothetical protein
VDLTLLLQWGNHRLTLVCHACPVSYAIR